MNETLKNPQQNHHIGESHDWQTQPVFDAKNLLPAGGNGIGVGVYNAMDQGGLNPNLNVQIIGHATVAPWSRSLFNGLAQIIVQSTRDAGEFKLTAGDGSGANIAWLAAPVGTVLQGKIRVPLPLVGWRRVVRIDDYILSGDAI